MPVIDAHAHVFTTPERSPRGVDELAPADRTATVDVLEERMDAAGVDHAVLVPLDGADDYVAACVQRDPVRFRGVAVATPVELGQTADDPIDALRRRRERFAFHAVRTMWLGEPGSDLAHSPARPLLEHMQETGLLLWSYLPPAQAPFLEQLGRDFPGLHVVLNHMGFTPHAMRVDEHRRPWFAEGLTPQRADAVAALARFEQFVLMFSGHYAMSRQPHPSDDMHDVGARLVTAFGAERTVWGTDFPWIDPRPGYTQVRELVDVALPALSSEQRRLILGGTAARLLGFAAP